MKEEIAFDEKKVNAIRNSISALNASFNLTFRISPDDKCKGDKGIAFQILELCPWANRMSTSNVL